MRQPSWIVGLYIMKGRSAKMYVHSVYTR